MTGIGLSGALHGIAAHGRILAGRRRHDPRPHRPSRRRLDRRVPVGRRGGRPLRRGSRRRCHHRPVYPCRCHGHVRRPEAVPYAASRGVRLRSRDAGGLQFRHRRPVCRSSRRFPATTRAETVRLPRLADTKYLRGVTGLITGSERYPGAAVLLAQGRGQDKHRHDPLHGSAGVP